MSAPELPSSRTAGETAPTGAFEARAHKLLADSVEKVEPRMRARLAEARRQALEQATPNRGAAAAARWLIPAGGVVAVVLAAMVWLLQDGREAGQIAAVPAEAGAPLDDLDMLSTVENLELLEELEFYAWLESEAALPATSNGTG